MENEMVKMQCEAGCKVFTGGERKHHRDCAFYPESLTKLWHDTENALTAEIERLRAIISRSRALTDHVIHGEPYVSMEDVHDALSVAASRKSDAG
jgi:hypothetical protein